MFFNKKSVIHLAFGFFERGLIFQMSALTYFWLMIRLSFTNPISILFFRPSLLSTWQQSLISNDNEFAIENGPALPGLMVALFWAAGKLEPADQTNDVQAKYQTSLDSEFHGTPFTPTKFFWSDENYCLKIFWIFWFSKTSFFHDCQPINKFWSLVSNIIGIKNPNCIVWAVEFFS